MLYCIRSKILLKIENNLLKKLLRKSKPFERISILSIIKRLNKIYFRIFIWNKFWSNFIAISFAFFTLFIGLIILQIYFGNSDLMFKILIYVILFLAISMITPFIHTASTPNTESKKTYKLLSNLFALNNDMRYNTVLSFRTTFKVYFKYYNSNVFCHYVLYFCIICSFS